MEECLFKKTLSKFFGTSAIYQLINSMVYFPMSARELKLRADLARLVKAEHKIITNTNLDVDTMIQNLGIAKRFREQAKKEKEASNSPVNYDLVSCYNQIHIQRHAPQQMRPLIFYREPCIPGLKKCIVRRIANEALPGYISMIDLQSISGMICIGGDGFMGVYSQDNGTCVVRWVTTTPFIRNCVRCVSVFSDSLLVFGSDDGYIRFYNRAYQAIIEEFPAHNDPISYITSMDPPFSFILSATDRGEVKTWNTRTLTCERTVQIGENESVRGYAPVPTVLEGEKLNSIIIVTHSGKAIVWNLETDELHHDDSMIASQKYANRYFSLKFDDRRVVATAEDDNNDKMVLDMNGDEITLVECSDRFVAIASNNVMNLWQVMGVD